MQKINSRAFIVASLRTIYMFLHPSDEQIDSLVQPDDPLSGLGDRQQGGLEVDMVVNGGGSLDLGPGNLGLRLAL
jgi:hypothetical protein